MPPLEAWEKVLIDREASQEDVHTSLTCLECHGGANVPEKDAAHEGLVADPSQDPQTCGQCHPSHGRAAPGSLHVNLQGYWTDLEARSRPESKPALEEMMNNHCTKCHASCGQCHISQPASVGGGLLEGHAIVARPPMSRTCTACHGSRVGDEYLGKNEGFLADVHFRQARMVCTDCHVAEEMHGQINPDAAYRYDGQVTPSCLSCHREVLSPESEILQHQLHGERLSCQVCHAVSYKNCDGCHTLRNEEGIPYFETEGSYLGFYIGLNPLQSEARPSTYVPLRHAPISEDSFAEYGEGLLSSFSALPTWRYATPHNIQRQTPQNSSCMACHGDPTYFLTPDKVREEELEANQSVIVTEIPPLISP